MLHTMTIDQLNAHVEIAREALANPMALGGMTASEAAALHLEALDVLMDELHARALDEMPSEECAVTPAGGIVGGRSADFVVLPRTPMQIVLANEVAEMVARQIPSDCPF